MDNPDTLLSKLTGWLVAAGLASKFFYDWIKSRAESGLAHAASITAETADDESLFARAYRLIDTQGHRIDELEGEVKELRQDVRRLLAVEDRALQDARVYERERAAWKERETYLEGRIATLTAAVAK